MSDWLLLVRTAFLAAQGVQGETYTYTPTSGTPFNAVGMFDESPQMVDVADVEIVGTLPVLDVLTSDHVERPRVGHGVVVRGRVYRVRRVEPAGPPALRLTLDPVAAPGVFGRGIGTFPAVVGDGVGTHS